MWRNWLDKKKKSKTEKKTWRDRFQRTIHLSNNSRASTFFVFFNQLPHIYLQVYYSLSININFGQIRQRIRYFLGCKSSALFFLFCNCFINYYHCYYYYYSFNYTSHFYYLSFIWHCTENGIRITFSVADDSMFVLVWT